MHTARRQSSDLNSVPVLKLPILSPAAYRTLQGKLFSLLKQMVTTARLALGATSCQAATCSPIRTSFAISGNCPLFTQKLCCQTLGAKLADNFSGLTLSWPAEERRCLRHLGRGDKGWRGGK